MYVPLRNVCILLSVPPRQRRRWTSRIAVASARIIVYCQLSRRPRLLILGGHGPPRPLLSDASALGVNLEVSNEVEVTPGVLTRALRAAPVGPCYTNYLKWF